MSLRLFGCGKFSWLSSESQDRDLNGQEQRFMRRHGAVCPECARRSNQRQMALNMLRLAALEPEVAPSFDERVLRRHRVETVRASLRYWSPALIGCAIAVTTMFAGLQMISRSSQLPIFHAAGVESRRLHSEGPIIPLLEEGSFRRAHPE